MSTATQSGKITQVIGSTFDAEFPENSLPPIYNAVEVEVKTADGETSILMGEISKHLGGGRVRCVALGSTDGVVFWVKSQNTSVVDAFVVWHSAPLTVWCFG